MTARKDPGYRTTEVVEDDGRLAMRRRADGAILAFVASQRDGGTIGARLVNRTVDPLDWYLHRRQISSDQHNAGDWLRRLHYAAYGSGYAKVNYAGVHGVADHSENWRFNSRQSHAISTIAKYLRSLAREEAYVVERVVYWGDYASDAARRLGVSERRGIGLLRSALSSIDRWRSEGLPEEVTCPGGEGPRG
jgi:hypothetical protein